MSSLKKIAPIFAVRDLAVSTAYYERLGFQIRMYEDGGYAFATRDRLELHLSQVPDGEHASHSSAYIWVDDADEIARAWTEAGADVRPPQDTEWRQHEGVVIDPDGNIIRFGSPIGK